MFRSTLPASPTTGFPQTDHPSTLADLSPQALARAGDAGPSTLSPSLLRDLSRYAADPVSAQLLPVVAASMRHGKALSLLVGLDDRTLSLALHPRRQLYGCDLDLCALLDQSFSRIRLQRVESDESLDAVPGSEIEPPLATHAHIGSLRPLLWHLALRGAFGELLPELAGELRCRVTLGVTLTGLPVDGAIRRLVQRMKSAPLSIDELMSATPLSRRTVQRVWNALYLQSALMVSRRMA